MILKSAWFCCMALIMATCLSAQPAPVEQEREAGRRAWIVAASKPENVDNLIQVLSGDKLHDVQLLLRGVGAPVPVDDTGVVRIVKDVTGPDGKVAYKNLAVARLAEGVREALIVLVSNDEEEEGLMFKSKVIDLAKFKRGGCLYVNLVKTKVGITIGEEKTVVNPGGMEFLNLLGDEKAAVKSIRFFYEIPKKPDAPEGEWKLMTASRMAIYRSRREICIFFYNKEIENVDFRGIPFITPPPRVKP